MNNINRILNLIKKTGDKFIVTDTDPFSDQSFVIMPFNEYEKIVEGRSDYSQMSEKELLDSVERDIALWRAEHESFDEAQDFQEDEEIKEYKIEPEPIKYEDIPPPPDVNIDDIMDVGTEQSSVQTQDKEDIIDYSFSAEGGSASGGEDEENDFARKKDEEDEFIEESVF